MKYLPLDDYLLHSLTRYWNLKLLFVWTFGMDVYIPAGDFRFPHILPEADIRCHRNRWGCAGLPAWKKIRKRIVFYWPLSVSVYQFEYKVNRFRYRILRNYSHFSSFFLLGAKLQFFPLNQMRPRILFINFQFWTAFPAMTSYSVSLTKSLETFFSTLSFFFVIFTLSRSSSTLILADLSCSRNVA